MVNKVSILDCTLRDGGYITGWNFGDHIIKSIIRKLTDAHIDYIECGFLNNKPQEKGKTQFQRIEYVENFLPEKRKSAYLAMADVSQYLPQDITEYTGNSIEGIRVVFYKHQIPEAINLGKRIVECGYKLFMQPMVTIDYTQHEYANLTLKLARLNPYSISIVDSFGYMTKHDFRQYFNILDAELDPDVVIGFHSHNNMQLAFTSAQDIFEYDTNRELMLDASICGMGRGAGNLHTEIITHYYNSVKGYKYIMEDILDIVSDMIMPISKEREWGYSPYHFLTGLYHCHPNFASYLLEMYNDVTVSEFREFVQTIPIEMKTKCRKPYVKELYEKFIKQRD